MSPTLFKLGSVVVSSYGFFYGLGGIVGLIILELCLRKYNISPRIALNVGIIVVVTAIIGAHLMSIIVDFGRYEDAAHILNPFMGGGYQHGGFLLSFPVVLWYLRRARVPFGVFSDCSAIAIPAIITISRIGCFLEGCCFGRVSDVAWAVRFPKYYSATKGLIGSPAFAKHLQLGLVTKSQNLSLSVCPTQLYSTVVFLTLFFVMLALWKKSVFQGRSFWFFLMIYAGIRFVLQTYRGDNEPLISFLDVTQITSIFLFLVGIILFLSPVKDKKASIE